MDKKSILKECIKLRKRIAKKQWKNRHEKNRVLKEYAMLVNALER